MFDWKYYRQTRLVLHNMHDIKINLQFKSFQFWYSPVLTLRHIAQLIMAIWIIYCLFYASGKTWWKLKIFPIGYTTVYDEYVSNMAMSEASIKFRITRTKSSCTQRSDKALVKIIENNPSHMLHSYFPSLNKHCSFLPYVRTIDISTIPFLRTNL